MKTTSMNMVIFNWVREGVTSPPWYDHNMHTHINSAGRSGKLQRCTTTAASCGRTAVSGAQCVSALDLYPKPEEPSVITSSPSAPPPRSGAFLLEAKQHCETLRVPSLNPSAHTQTHTKKGSKHAEQFLYHMYSASTFCLCVSVKRPVFLRSCTH